MQYKAGRCHLRLFHFYFKISIICLDEIIMGLERDIREKNGLGAMESCAVNERSRRVDKSPQHYHGLLTYDPV
jgi:hypothetical protein